MEKYEITIGNQNLSINKSSNNPKEIEIIINGKVRKCISQEKSGIWTLRYGDVRHNLAKIYLILSSNQTWDEKKSQYVFFKDSNKSNFELSNLQWVDKKNQNANNLVNKIIMFPEKIEFNSQTEAAIWISENTESTATIPNLKSVITRHLNKTLSKGELVNNIWGRTFKRVDNG